MPRRPSYSRDTQAAIDQNNTADDIASNRLTVRQKVNEPELVYSPNARLGYSSFLHGDAERKLRKDNPDLTDEGVKQTMRVGAKNYVFSDPATAGLPKYHRGGRVRKTGPARLRKGEMVLTKTQQRAAGLSRRRSK